MGWINCVSKKEKKKALLPLSPLPFYAEKQAAPQMDYQKRSFINLNKFHTLGKL